MGTKMNAYTVTLVLYNGDAYTEGSVASSHAAAIAAIMDYFGIKESEVRNAESERVA